MKKEEQTVEVKVRLYNLTLMFIKKYKWRYYKQYRGELEDLAMDFYEQFLTAKSREKGKEQSLLDKFDPSITTLEYLVKIAVQRMLIDRSRHDCRPIKSIDRFTDAYGDCITKTFALYSTEDEEEGHVADTRVFTRTEVAVMKMKWYELSEKARETITKQFEEVKGVLSEPYRDALEDVIYSE